MPERRDRCPDTDQVSRIRRDTHALEVYLTLSHWRLEISRICEQSCYAPISLPTTPTSEVFTFSAEENNPKLLPPNAFSGLTMVAFFNSFRKGPLVCRGLDLDLSGKVAKKRL